MKIQAFIADWDSPHTRAKIIEHQIIKSTNVSVKILSRRNEPWAYQWEEAVSRFTGDVMLWIMADTVLNEPSFRTLIEKMRDIYNMGDVWMYAPNLNYTSQIYNTTRLTPYCLGVYEVCGTDLVFTSVHRNLLRLLPNLGTNIRGWGYDYLMTYFANQMGKKVLRDYNFTVDHPKTNSYDLADAQDKMEQWLVSLPKTWRAGLLHQQSLQEQLCRP